MAKNGNKIEYYVNFGSSEEYETEIECELQLGDYCSVEISTGFIELKVVKRTYYPIVEQWIFWCEIAINNDLK